VWQAGGLVRIHFGSKVAYAFSLQVTEYGRVDQTSIRLRAFAKYFVSALYKDLRTFSSENMLNVLETQEV
jgi:hypothetical protein